MVFKEILLILSYYDIIRMIQYSLILKSLIVFLEDMLLLYENIESVILLLLLLEIDVILINLNSGIMSFQEVIFRQYFEGFLIKNLKFDKGCLGVECILLKLEKYIFII